VGSDETVLLRVAEVMRRRRAVVGRILDESGRPLGGLRVRVLAASYEIASGKRSPEVEDEWSYEESVGVPLEAAWTRTDGDGRFRAGGFGEAPTRVLIDDPAWYVRADLLETPAAGERTWTAVPGVAFQIEGVDAAGRPISGLRVWSRSSRGGAWNVGRARLGDAPPALATKEDRLRVRCAYPPSGALDLAVLGPDDFATPTFRLVRGRNATPFLVRFGRPVRRGRVRAVVSALGRSRGIFLGASLSLWTLASGLPVAEQDTSLEADSNVVSVPEGSYRYEIRPVGFGLLAQEGTVEVREGETQVLELAVPPLGTLQLQESPAVARVEREVVLVAPGVERRARWDTDLWAPVGRFTVFEDRGGDRRRLGDVTIVEGETTTLRVPPR
jgi:hypothetical protein